MYSKKGGFHIPLGNMIWLKLEKLVINIKDEYIKLGQALKLSGLVDSGVDAKFVVQDGLVKVNGEIDTRRGKKLYPGDSFEYKGTVVTVE